MFQLLANSMKAHRPPGSIPWGQAFATPRQRAFAWGVWIATFAIFLPGLLRMMSSDGDSTALREATATAIGIIQVLSIVRFIQHATLKYLTLLLLTLAWAAAFTANQYGLLPTLGHALMTLGYVVGMLFVGSRRGEVRRPL